MSPTVALAAVGAHGDTAVGSRIGAFARGLTRRGWHVTVIDPPLPHATLIERLLGHTPTALRSMLHHAGVEGDVQPVAGWRVRRALRGVDADVVVVSVPPFSLLGAATMARDPPVPLILATGMGAVAPAFSATRCGASVPQSPDSPSSAESRHRSQPN